MDRATLVCGAIGIVFFLAGTHRLSGAEPAGPALNVAAAATASTSFVSGHETIDALNDGNAPRDSNDKSHGAYGNWPQTGRQWVQYDWPQAISTNRVAVYWFDDNQGVRLPKSCTLSYWDGKQFIPVANSRGLGLEKNKFNTTTFDSIATMRLRLEMDGSQKFSTGILEWRVYDDGKSPNFPPVAVAGADRVAILPAKTHLAGRIRDDGKPQGKLSSVWSKESGPGEVKFDDANALATTAEFSAAGQYVLKLSASDGQLSASDTLKVSVENAPPARPLQIIPTRNYSIESPFWRQRAKMLIVNWIPYCYDKCSDPATKEGGIDNIIEAGNKLAGKPFKPHHGYVFANAWVVNTLEAMCVGMMVDPQGDADIIAAQKRIRDGIEDWIPKLLAAQEPDGYFQSAYTLSGRQRWTNKHDHEGYIAGYFIESAIAHHEMTGRKDTRLYNAAKKMADCWWDHIGPAPKRAWYEGHQELELALVRLARHVEEIDGPGRGRKYVELARFLMDSRRDGAEYDQSHAPATQQYEAVGHAVRAVYSYTGMADIAMETGDIDYHSAIRSIWNNLINKKYYVTGGVGSGETAEGFGKNYSLPQNAYNESCSGCGEVFFQHRMNLIHHDARYADLVEETLYNAILGSVDLEAKHFTYTNPLDQGHARYLWHVCPCCVGNIPRTLLSLPTWMYARDEDGLYVNLFIGSTVDVGSVAGTPVKMIQQTDYPWSGKVAITVRPAEEKRFAIRIRVPDRSVSELYSSAPDSNGIASLAVNGELVAPVIEKGYAVIARNWKPGDKIDLELPMKVQRVKAIDKVASCAGKVALRVGPLIYSLESADQKLDKPLVPESMLTAEWRPELLGGVMVIKGAFADGSPMLAIPNYARNNRGGKSMVWVRDR